MTNMNLQEDFILVDILRIEFGTVNERICKIRAELKYRNLTLISTHAPPEVAKEEMYSFLGKVSDEVPNHDMKTVLRDFNAKVGNQSYLHPACDGQRLHNETNDNGNEW
jgi:hypothetical protein